MPGLGLQRLDRHARLPQAGQTGVAQLVAGAVRQPRPGPGAGDDLVQPVDRQRLAPARPFEHDEQPVRGGARRSLGVHVGRTTVAKKLGETGHRPLMATLALGDEHPPLTQAQILESKAEHLASAQAAQHHRLHHCPVPLRAQRPQRRHLRQVRDARQLAHGRTHGWPRTLPPVARVGRPRGHGVRLHPSIAAG